MTRTSQPSYEVSDSNDYKIRSFRYNLTHSSKPNYISVWLTKTGLIKLNVFIAGNMNRVTVILLLGCALLTVNLSYAQDGEA